MNTIPLVVFLQKNTNIVESFFTDQVVGTISTTRYISGISTFYEEGHVYVTINCGCSPETKSAGIATQKCYVYYEYGEVSDQKVIKLNREEFDVLEFNSENYPQNTPFNGSVYDSNQNKFYAANPPVEGYILNESTLEWHPDPEKTYDLHGDGKEYRYDPENTCWWPV